MRILYICSEYPPGPHGGVGTFVQILGRALVQSGHSVSVVGIYSTNHPAPDFEIDKGVRVWRLREPNLRYIGWIIARVRLYKFVTNLVRNGAVDLVEVNDGMGWMAGWPSLPVPKIVRLHASFTYYSKELQRPVRRITTILEKDSLKRADCLSAVSEYVANKTREYLSLPERKVTILYNPVDECNYSSFDTRSKNRVIFTGTLNERKGVISLIRAWEKVKNACKEAELHLFGKDGRTRDNQSMKEFLFRNYAEILGNDVYFHSHVDRNTLKTFLRTARVAVFPSYSEAFAIAPLEAMSCGCPTIYTRRSSGPELIEHGKDGLLIDPDDHEEIARMIISVLRNDNLARQLGEAGMRKVKAKFSLKTLLPQNEAFYRKCISAYKKNM